ncbi:mitogen-activated protein kinase kinase kinase 20-like isoform X2 [Acanthaster planci]|uniref:Mitogen-activated protein kinase kinase kinase 20-like isoform X2 n=1 Tax=Acanthaster planci TaxID=133434 RepID=A0A8B7ZSN4_ACAPL|nr:mitogen-activated protein kinase kinase kinase 20-like isoform X2 [Acanthaster planci]
MEGASYVNIDRKDISVGPVISSGACRNKVCRATWTLASSEKTVAVKVCNNFHEDEVLILAKLKHANVIEFFGVVKPASAIDSYMIVTEYAEQGSLYDVIRQHRDNWPEYRQNRWMRWAQDGAKALEYIHQKGYQHGDVKSPNYLVTHDDTLKICDFGISRKWDFTISTVTNRGSYPWMAPEVFGNVADDSKSERKPCKVTTKSDVFSYGVVIWEMISGKAPYPDKVGFHIYKAVVERNERLQIPCDFPEHQQISDLLSKCWQANYKERPSMQKILRDLADIENGQRKTVGTSDNVPDAVAGPQTTPGVQQQTDAMQHFMSQEEPKEKRQKRMEETEGTNAATGGIPTTTAAAAAQLQPLPQLPQTRMPTHRTQPNDSGGDKNSNENPTGTLDDRSLYGISRYIAPRDLLPLSLQLGLSSAEFSQVEADHPQDFVRQTFSILVMWRNNLPHDVNQKEAFCVALEKVGRKDLAMQLAEF